MKLLILSMLSMFIFTGCGAIIVREEPQVPVDQSEHLRIATEMAAERNIPTQSYVAMRLTSDEMAEFEEEHYLPLARERYLAFGAFIPTHNRESSRVFPLTAEPAHAARLLSDGWGITDGESALVQIRALAEADGQSPVADDIFRVFASDRRFSPLSAMDLFEDGFNPTGLENLYASAVRRSESRQDEFYAFAFLLEAHDFGLTTEEMFELFILMEFADRVNQGMEAFSHASQLLVAAFEFTEEELQNLPTLAAWDFGRTAFVARYSVAAGFLEEEDVWGYLKQAADGAAKHYDNWREYTAAYILGRALAFGNSSMDMIPTIDFLLNHPASPFETASFSN